MNWFQWLFPFLYPKCWGCKERTSRWKMSKFYLKTNEGISSYKICEPCAKVLEYAKVQQKLRSGRSE